MQMNQAIITTIGWILLVTSVLGAVDDDLIGSLPGLSVTPSFKQYSGYLKATDSRMLHYWFVESAGNPSADPVVLWLNGGPGCSSLDGFLSEHGPFLAQDDGKTLEVNPHSWNKIANMLYLEAPAGVGYSYKPDKNYTTNDDQTSLDNYWALKYFFSKYPEFSQNEFYITGESYGGIYVPTLSVRVAEDSSFNYKGSAIGNGFSSAILNSKSLMFFGYYHGLWGQELWNELVQTCCKNGNSSNCDFSSKSSTDCQMNMNKAGEFIQQMNVYNLYAPCYQGPDGHISESHDAAIPVTEFLLPSWARSKPKAFQGVQTENVGVVPPCINVKGATEYLNQDIVRTALHIPSMLPKWEICSGTVGFLYKRQYDEMSKFYQELLQSGQYRLLVYNGDVDMACNYLMDEWFVDSLNQQVVEPRKVWHYTDTDGSTQVAGFVKQFKNINFVTVKGSGHMVPQDKPIPAFDMFQRFLTNKPY